MTGVSPSASPLSTSVEVVASERVLTATLANPPDNRVTADMLRGLGAAVDRFESEDFDLLVIRGAGRSFSKGFDLQGLGPEADQAQMRDALLQSNVLFTRIAKLEKPTVAAIHGACLGGGLELALTCHFRLCSDKTRLGLPEVWLGLVPGLGGFYRLAKVIGRPKALEMVALGDLVNAEDALRVGIVNRVFPKERFDEGIQSFVGALLMADRQALAEIMRLNSAMDLSGEEDNIRQGMQSFARLAATWSPKSPN